MSESPVIDTPPPPSGWLGDLHLAAVFLTRLPLPLLPDPTPGALARAMRCFPLAGAGLGLIGGLAAVLASLALPPLPSALLAVLAVVLATGALHEDGLADLADGLGARGDRDKRLEVMRDSRNGTFGVLALIFSVGLRTSALTMLGSGSAMAWALVAASALSRAMIPAAMQVMAPARPDGLGASAGLPDASVAATAAALGLGIAVMTLGVGGALAAAVAALIGALAMVVLARRALGGFTGDVLGAVQQAAEIAILLAVAAS